MMILAKSLSGFPTIHLQVLIEHLLCFDYRAEAMVVGKRNPSFHRVPSRMGLGS